MRNNAAKLAVVVGLAAPSMACSRTNAAYDGGGGNGSAGGSASSAGLPSGAATTVTSATADGTVGGTATTDAQTTDAQTTDPTMGVDPCGPGSGCDPNAQCIDVGGDPECVCLDGWFGDGTSCEPIDLLTVRVDTPCDGSAICDTLPQLCPMDQDETTTQLVGDPNVLYDVTLRVRGALEPHNYVGGTDNGWYNVGGDSAGGGRNVAGFTVEEPEETYYVNLGVILRLECFVLDEEITLQMQGGSELSVYMDAADGCGIHCAEYRVPGLYPSPANDSGQFFQLDLISAVAAAKG
ncbi:MAG: hypothetical protein K0V04_09835 [Deltaproteobacteria bacterium]|nr:hypothetical protein [Deltaproteobacteria bacterium]